MHIGSTSQMNPSRHVAAVAGDIHSHLTTYRFGSHIGITFGNRPLLRVRYPVVNRPFRHHVEHLPDDTDGLPCFATTNERPGPDITAFGSRHFKLELVVHFVRVVNTYIASDTTSTENRAYHTMFDGFVFFNDTNALGSFPEDGIIEHQVIVIFKSFLQIIQCFQYTLFETLGQIASYAARPDVHVIHTAAGKFLEQVENVVPVTNAPLAHGV